MLLRRLTSSVVARMPGPVMGTILVHFNVASPAKGSTSRATEPRFIQLLTQIRGIAGVDEPDDAASAVAIAGADAAAAAARDVLIAEQKAAKAAKKKAQRAAAKREAAAAAEASQEPA